MKRCVDLKNVEIIIIYHSLDLTQKRRNTTPNTTATGAHLRINAYKIIKVIQTPKEVYAKRIGWMDKS